MLVIRFNDAAIEALGGPVGSQAAAPVAELTPQLRAVLAEGVEWDDGAVRFGDPPEERRSGYDDLTWWEWSVTKMHLEDYVPVQVGDDGTGGPLISAADQLVLLRQGFGFALEILRMARELRPTPPFRGIVSVNDTCGTFRFHVGRPGEHSLADDLDACADDEKGIVIDSGPYTLGGVPW